MQSRSLISHLKTNKYSQKILGNITVAEVITFVILVGVVSIWKPQAQHVEETHTKHPVLGSYQPMPVEQTGSDL